MTEVSQEEREIKRRNRTKPHGNKGNKYAAKDVKKDSNIHCLCYRSERDLWVKAARGDLSKWVRNALNKAARVDIALQLVKEGSR